MEQTRLDLDYFKDINIFNLINNVRFTHTYVYYKNVLLTDYPVSFHKIVEDNPIWNELLNKEKYNELLLYIIECIKSYIYPLIANKEDWKLFDVEYDLDIIKNEIYNNTIDTNKLFIKILNCLLEFSKEYKNIKTKIVILNLIAELNTEQTEPVTILMSIINIIALLRSDKINYLISTKYNRYILNNYAEKEYNYFIKNIDTEYLEDWLYETEQTELEYVFNEGLCQFIHNPIHIPETFLYDISFIKEINTLFKSISYTGIAFQLNNSLCNNKMKVETILIIMQKLKNHNRIDIYIENLSNYIYSFTQNSMTKESIQNLLLGIDITKIETFLYETLLEFLNTSELPHRDTFRKYSLLDFYDEIITLLVIIKRFKKFNLSIYKPIYMEYL